MSTKLECINPIRIVRDIKVSLDYYVRVLGFKKGRMGDGGVRVRDGVARRFWDLSLREPEATFEGPCLDRRRDIGPLHQEIMAAGAHIAKPPTNYSWAYEMVVEDPGGHALRIGSDPKKNVPFND